MLYSVLVSEDDVNGCCRRIIGTDTTLCSHKLLCLTLRLDLAYSCLVAYGYGSTETSSFISTKPHSRGYAFPKAAFFDASMVLALPLSSEHH